MTDTTASLINALVGVLATQNLDLSWPTDAQARVYAPRDWPSWDRQYPVIFVSAPMERKEGLGRNSAPAFFVTTTCRISARVSEPAAVNDASAGAAEAELWVLQRQIEVAVINAYGVQLRLQQIPSVETRLAYSSDGATHLAGLMMEVACEFYQDATDFAQPPYTTPDTVRLAGDLTNVEDPKGTYVPPFPYAVVPPIRTVGPDGRVEIAADIPVNV